MSKNRKHVRWGWNYDPITKKYGRYVIVDENHIKHFMCHNFKDWAVFIITNYVQSISTDEEGNGTAYFRPMEFVAGGEKPNKRQRKPKRFHKRNGSRRKK